jgi:nucleotide-binding universal stress UspA family protein
MLPIRRILAPTDFSDRSLPAIQLAVELARHFSAELVTAHVMTPVMTAGPAVAGQSPMNYDVYREALVGDSRQRLDELTAKIVPAEVSCRSEVRWGSPAETIVELADSNGCDLIVISTRGATGLSRFVAGSVTEKVVRTADMPVLTVQGDVDD